MDINKILTSRRVNMTMQATNKEEAIQELTNLLYDDGALTSKEDFMQDVWQREAEVSTPALKTILPSRTANPAR